MPKEQIRTYREDGTLHVGWSKEGGNTVQVGVGVKGLSVGDVSYDDVWAHLDREGINTLIRALRKARDNTFGADA